MNRNFVFRNATDALPRLLAFLSQCPEIDSRGGKVREQTMIGITLEKPLERELLVEDRKPNLAAQIFETMWVLSGRDDMESLLRYLPRAADFSDDGQRWRAGYGARLRGWEAPQDGQHVVPTVDQLRYVVETLKRDPLSRQAVMSIWDPAIDTEPGKDIPCNNWLSFSLRDDKLDLHVAIRSNDVIWGWSGINQFEWSALQEIVAGLVDVEVGALHFSVTSFHIYERHWEKADRIIKSSASSQRPASSPRFDLDGLYEGVEDFDALCADWFKIEEAIRLDPESAVNAVNTFPEPMLRSWLRVLQWWWTCDTGYLTELMGTRLGEATRYSVQPKDPEPVAQKFDTPDLKDQPVLLGSYVPSWSSPFIRGVVELHDEKDRAYGDSWMRRGEMLGIMANIARKIDRLEGAATADETSADTAIDLLVYLAKYRAWLDTPSQANDTVRANSILIEQDEMLERDGHWATMVRHLDSADLARYLTEQFEKLEAIVTLVKSGQTVDTRKDHVDGMLKFAYRLARLRVQQADSLAVEKVQAAIEELREAPRAEGAGHAERNARRAWNPETKQPEGKSHNCEHATMLHPCWCYLGDHHTVNALGGSDHRR